METAQYLIENSIKPSYQRVRIMNYLLDKKNHPTVDMIYQELIPEIPTLSKTTVYNTLKNFVEKGIAQVITIEEHEARFDADVSIHGHFKCRICRTVYDVWLESEPKFLSMDDKFIVEKNHIYLTGICKNCNK